MDNTLVILNFLAYFVTLLVIYRKRRRVTAGVFLLFCYTVVSFFCVINYNMDPSQWDFSALFFIYLFVAIILLLKPFLDNGYEIKAKSYVINQNFYKNVAWGYIFLATFASIVYLPIAREAISNPNWAELYLDAHEEKESTMFTKLANLFFHLRYLGVTLLFFFVSRKGTSLLFKTSLLMMTILPLCLVTIANASRGGFVEIFVVFIISLTLFRNILSKSVVKVLKILGLIVVPLAFLYLSAVTIARFEDTGYADTIGDTVIIYLGHSMLSFVYGIADTINQFAWGGYMFGTEDPDVKNGTHVGSGFITIVGNLYWDFGPIFTIIIILLINRFWNRVSRRNMGIPEFFLLLTYCMILYKGVFVLGKGWGVQLFEAFVIYFLLCKFQGKKRIKKQVVS